jgi:predicted dithiol-disulfide oxidoreductase (DUF899 family)
MATEWWNDLKSITLLADTDAPPMVPAGASDEYRAARESLVEAEVALRDQIEAVAAMRRALPPGVEVANYRLTEGSPNLDDDGPARTVDLIDLFGDHDELVVYHLMFHPDDDAACAMCSLWVDGLHGVSHHLARRTAFSVVGKAPIEKLRAWGRRRGWHGLRVVSAFDSTFNVDLGIEGSQGGQFPAVSVLRRDGDNIRHAYTQSADLPGGGERGIDVISPVWHVFDLLPSGRGNWLPDNEYPGATRGG